LNHDLAVELEIEQLAAAQADVSHFGAYRPRLAPLLLGGPHRERACHAEDLIPDYVRLQVETAALDELLGEDVAVGKIQPLKLLCSPHHRDLLPPPPGVRLNDDGVVLNNGTKVLNAASIVRIGCW
jgi:hypothetical protein